MCGNPLEILSPVAGIFGAASRAKKALKAQNAAQAASIALQAKTTADAQKAEANRTRTPNFAAMLDRNSITNGVSSTMLTGPMGVSNGLTLAKNSLLGG